MYQKQATTTRMVKWAKGFITNTSKEATKHDPRTYEDVVEQYERSGIPIVTRDDATDIHGKSTPFQMAIYVDVEAIKGKIGIDDAIQFVWRSTKDDWDGVRWSESASNTGDSGDAYDRAMQIL